MDSSHEPSKAPPLPNMVFEWSAKRNSRTGQIENEIITVRGMNAKYFFANVQEVRDWINALPRYGGSSVLPDAAPPAECPECGGTEFYDNRTDEKPNWRCKNKKCGHKVFIPLEQEGAAE